MGACSGKCCAVFNYPTPPDKLRERSEGYDDDGAKEDRFLADMLVALTPEQAQERALRFEIDAPEGTTIEEWVHGYPAYTCRHWDEETRLCGVYDTRPRMCAEYPYDRACQHDKCCTYQPPAAVQERWAAIHAEQEASS